MNPPKSGLPKLSSRMEDYGEVGPEQLVKAFLRRPMTGPISVPECEGDGFLMAIDVGAGLSVLARD